MDKPVTGRIHSLETFGTVDGPGIRFVVFMQGCPLRCQYCHNPDTWSLKGGREATAKELIDELRRYLPYIEASRGGITVSGGEPALQADFVAELFRQAKELGVHTALDTNGYNPERIKKILPYTDLVLLDLKMIDPERHRQLTGCSNRNILKTAKLLAEQKVPVWIRYTLVPGVTDRKEDLTHLGRFLQTLGNVEKVEVNPYHTMGVYKWEQLGLSYPLEGIRQASEDEGRHARDTILQAMKGQPPA